VSTRGNRPRRRRVDSSQRDAGRRSRSPARRPITFGVGLTVPLLVALFAAAVWVIVTIAFKR
jgi:hypothetical protein